MTTQPAAFPSFLLCCRCSSAVDVVATQETKRWSALVQDRKTTLDICPHCTEAVLRLLRSTPDPLEDLR